MSLLNFDSRQQNISESFDSRQQNISESFDSHQQNISETFDSRQQNISEYVDSRQQNISESLINTGLFRWYFTNNNNSLLRSETSFKAFTDFS